MKRVKLVVAYDGTNYCGWQIQSNGVTIEEVLNKALSDLLKEPVAVIGASRTDSGVHAEGNVAVFDTENRMPADKICFALNQRLPGDIRILHSQEVPEGWHPRKQNCVKTYEYRILNRKIDMPTLRLYTHFCYTPLDVEKMKAAAAYIIGEHDFKSFCSARTQVEETVRTVYSLTIEKTGDVITMRISGSGFLYNMVRIIAGTLIKVGMGVYPPEHVEEILDGRNRQMAGPKASARGLTLISMDYERELRPVIEGENKDWKYQLIQQEILPKKKAYLIIERCAEEDFDRLLTRVTHQAVRNGAREVFVCDKQRDDRIEPGKAYGYYKFQHELNFLEMKRKVAQRCDLEKGIQEVSLEPVAASDVPSFCQMHNDIFFHVPNSETLTTDVMEGRLDREIPLYIKKGGQTAGIVILERKDEDELELCILGVLEEFRNQGVAEAVLANVNALAAGQGAGTLSLLVADINEPACLLYQKHGFHVEKRISRWYRTLAGYPDGQN